MDFKELLLEAEKKQTAAAKQAHQVKRINTQIQKPAKKESKYSEEKSEFLLRRIKEAEEEKRKKEEAKERKEREEKKNKVFRIPKKTVKDDPPSDAESFSSISSDDEAEVELLKARIQKEMQKSSSKYLSEKSGSKSSSSKELSEKSRQTSSQGSSKHTSLNSKHTASKTSSKKENHKDSKTDIARNHTHSKDRRSSDQMKPNSSSSHQKSSDKDKSVSAHNHSQKTHSSLHSHADKSRSVVNKSASNCDGYVTSPNLSSEDEKKPSTESRLPSNQNRRESTGIKQEEDSAAPIELTRHHLKPNIEREGGLYTERMKTLAKLQAIKERMNAEEEAASVRKRYARGDVKKRRAKREKIDGDFTGSCMDKVNYDEEEKPSLKRPEPRPEPEKQAKENLKGRLCDKSRPKKHDDKTLSDRHRAIKDSKDLHQNSFNVERKDKIKRKAPAQRPPLSFNELMKLAEKNDGQPVMVDVAPKKKDVDRPLSQEEKDRKKYLEERRKTEEYKQWYQHGHKMADKKQNVAGNSGSKDAQSGGFLRRPESVMPSDSHSNQSKPSFSVPRKSDAPKTAKNEKHKSTTDQRHASSQQCSSFTNQSSSKTNPQPHPARPCMIANKPHAMAQRMNGEQNGRPGSDQKAKTQTSSHSKNSSLHDKTKGSNAWDALFSRPEYKKEPPVSKKRKRVIESDDEEDDDMDDFIDDDDEDEGITDISSTIQQLFGYDRRKYRYDEDDDISMEASFSQVMKEEARSARIGRQEDLEDIRKEQEELKRKRLKKMRR